MDEVGGEVGAPAWHCPVLRVWHAVRVCRHHVRCEYLLESLGQVLLEHDSTGLVAFLFGALLLVDVVDAAATPPTVASC